MIESGDSSIKRSIEERGFVVLHPKGRSMRPFIKENDTVVVKRCEKIPSTGDCVVFERADGRIVLHRVVKVSDRGVLTRGDFERFYDAPILFSQILGVVTEIRSNNKTVSVSDQRYIKRYERWNGKGRSFRLFFYRFFVRASGFLKRIIGIK